MTRVLIVNHAHSSVCGIHDLGLRLYHQLEHSIVLEMGYAEASDGDTYRAAANAFEPDAIIVNYRADLTPWCPTYNMVPTLAVAHQYDASTIDQCAWGLIAAGFDYVLALDPDLHPGCSSVFPVGRPIPTTVDHNGLNDPPHVGSFGFAFPHKGFATVAGEIADQCDTGAVYELHMPEAFFNGANGADLYTAGILDSIHLADGQRLHYTSEHLVERELVARLAANDVNCLFYVPGQPDAGLSSALDYLVAARRPILTTDCAMFRHVPVNHWPATRLGAILAEHDRYQADADALYEAMSARVVRDIEAVMDVVAP